MTMHAYLRTPTTATITIIRGQILLTNCDFETAIRHHIDG